VVAQVQSVGLGKGYGYIQTGPSSVMLDPRSTNYAFIPTVDGINISGITPPFMSGPYNLPPSQSNGGVFVFNTGDNGWRFGAGGQGFAATTLANMDAAIPGGTYTITVNGNAIPLTLAGDAYPNAPIMSFSGGGAWAGGEYVVDPAQPITITTNAFTGYGTHVDDAICLVAFLPGYVLPFQFIAPFGCDWTQVRQFASQVPGVNTVSYNIPANTLVAGQSYGVQGIFAAVVDSRPIAGLPGSRNVAFYYVRTKATIKATTPVFPMTVTKNIGPTVSSATADIQFRPQDVGTSGAVFTFFVAPSTKVVNAATMDKSAVLATRPKGDIEKDGSVQCVLAQLNSSGQLQAVSASNLQAYVTGVLSGQGQAVTMLNNTLTANIAGTTIYVGYGQNALNMLTAGLNRRAVTVPGTVSCDPQAPETGWWWNTAEGGRGYSIEVAGNHIFFASYLYDVSGRATWLVASGNTSLDGSLFTGNLEAYAQGQTLSGPYRAPSAPTNPGALTLAFNDARHGTMTWPGGSVAIERFNIVPDGLNQQKRENQPEGGWWFNPSESGRGFFMEWQGGELFMAGYMYDDNGQPIWYLSSNTTPSTNLQAYQNTWWQYANGQTLSGAYRPATRINDNVAPLTITFQGSENAIMTLPGGRTTAIRRFRF
jgi:hypothetical protein